MAFVRLGSYRVPLPQSVWKRRLLGCGLVLGGCLWFLPVVGLWMLPLGLFVLSIDSRRIRRWRRRRAVRAGRWLKRRWPRLARALGYAAPAAP